MTRQEHAEIARLALQAADQLDVLRHVAAAYRSQVLTGLYCSKLSMALDEVSNTARTVAESIRNHVARKEG